MCFNSKHTDPLMVVLMTETRSECTDCWYWTTTVSVTAKLNKYDIDINRILCCMNDKNSFWNEYKQVFLEFILLISLRTLFLFVSVVSRPIFKHFRIIYYVQLYDSYAMLVLHHIHIFGMICISFIPITLPVYRRICTLFFTAFIISLKKLMYQHKQ